MLSCYYVGCCCYGCCCCYCCFCGCFLLPVVLLVLLFCGVKVCTTDGQGERRGACGTRSRGARSSKCFCKQLAWGTYAYARRSKRIAYWVSFYPAGMYLSSGMGGGLSPGSVESTHGYNAERGAVVSTAFETILFIFCSF